MTIKNCFLFSKLSPKERLIVGLSFLGMIIFAIGLTSCILSSSKTNSQEKNQELALALVASANDHEQLPSLETDQVNEQIMVDIGGAVINPGLKTINYDPSIKPRLYLIIEEAGGWDKQVNQEYLNKELNLARIVTDGEKIYIPYEFEEYQTATLSHQDNSTNSNFISLNQSSSEELQKLIGIGEAKANKIIENRPYTSLEEGISKKVITQLIWDNNAEVLVL